MDRNKALAVISQTVDFPTGVSDIESLSILDLQIDSIEIVQMSIDIEDQLGLEFDLDNVVPQTTLGELLDSMVRTGC